MIVTTVFKATIGLLVNKGRDKAAEKLKDGDVTDQIFRRLIVREIDEVKSKLDGLSRKDLLASISFFKEGIELLYVVFKKARSRKTQQACADQAFSLAEEMKKLQLIDLDESATKALNDAKERFKDARLEATKAFNNEALETSDRILAMQHRVMASILEKLDNPANAVATCRVCIEELHCLPAVQECFNVELTKGLRARFSKDERRKNISNVCHVNFVLYNVVLMACFGNVELSNWPCIGSGENKVDPLRDKRVHKVLRKQGMEHCCVTTWSFGQDGEEEHKLKSPWGIASNCSGQFIVGDYGDSNVKLFDSTGSFKSLCSLPYDEIDTKLYVVDVATDMKDNIYVLASLKKPGAERYEWVAYEFDNTADLHQKFPVRGGVRLTVTDSGKVLVLRSDDVVDVYETDGQFVHSFGKDILKGACNITAANDGRVMVVGYKDHCVHIISEQGDRLIKFELQGHYSCPRIAFHRTSEHVVVAGLEQDKDLLQVEVYTKDGEFARSTEIHEERIGIVEGITVTTEGRIAVACDKKVLVI